MKAYRMFEILLILLNKRKVTSTELAKKFEVSVRTIYRDLEELSLAGVPIYTTTGKNGGVNLMENYVIEKSFITDIEKSDIIFALQSLGTVPNLEESEVIKKLTALFGYTANLINPIWFDVDFSKWHNTTESESFLFNQLKEAVIFQKSVKLNYISNKLNEQSRIVDPLKLIFKYKDWYVFGYCKFRQDFRLFKLNRIINCEILQQQFLEYTNIPIPYINNYVNQEATIHTVLMFSKDVAQKVYESFEHSLINRDFEKHICVSGKLEVDDWLYSLLLSFGSDVYVKEPLNVRNELCRRHREAVKVLSDVCFE